jgi:cysteinyl-tRNA synthetase
MPLRLFNTLSGKVQEFIALQDRSVRMYACGPTVYDYGHIGNFRTFVAVDVLHRFLRQDGYQVRYVMNITDVDDKIIRNSAKAGVNVRDYTRKYEQAFLEDIATLHVERPQLVRATDCIPQMARFIAQLEKKGYAYRTDDGSYYFRIAKFPSYGKLSKKDFSGIEVGARVDVDEYDKDNARDFALWKAPKSGEAFWETEIGPGRPGWHIECSVMSTMLLGPTFDLHAGGEDLVFPHHENEIAQSEAETGQPFVRYWFHVRFLLVEGEKMSKSLGNFYTLRDLVLKGHKPSSIRFLLASGHYRTQLNFTFAALEQAANSVERLRNFEARLQSDRFREGPEGAMGKLARDTMQKMRASLEDDLNTPQALGALFEMVRQANAAADAGQVYSGDVPALQQALQQFEEVFAVLRDDDAASRRRILDWAKTEGKLDEAAKELVEVAGGNGLPDEQVETLVAEHERARRARDFARSDAIRAQLAQAGIVVENTKQGVRWKRK